MNEQLTIFDFIKSDVGECDIETLPEDEMIRMISEATGIDFYEIPNILNTPYKWFESKHGKTYMSVHYSNYSYGDYKRFISVGVQNLTEGCGMPCDSLNEAIGVVKRNAKRYGWRT